MVVVDNLKVCLTRDEKRAMWEAPTSIRPEALSGQLISPLDLPLYEAGYVGGEPISPGRKDNKRRRRKTQSKLRNTNNFSPSTTPVEFSPRSFGKKKITQSPLHSPMRSITNRLGLRNQERMKAGILVPIRD